MAVCWVCTDNRGFVCRPCPTCGRQKPADAATAARYGIQPGELVTDEARRAFEKRISTGKPLGNPR